VDVVVDLVLQHAHERPDESLGVITMGIKHANRIEECLRQRLRADPDLAEELTEFFDENSPLPANEVPKPGSPEQGRGPEPATHRPAAGARLGRHQTGPDDLVVYSTPAAVRGTAFVRVRKMTLLTRAKGQEQQEPDKVHHRSRDVDRLQRSCAWSRRRRCRRAGTACHPRIVELFVYVVV
jgi:hypothetical protein